MRERERERGSERVRQTEAGRQRATELQVLLPVFVCYVVVAVPRGHMGEGMLSPPGRCLSPYLLRVSGSCQVLVQFWCLGCHRLVHVPGPGND